MLGAGCTGGNSTRQENGEVGERIAGAAAAMPLHLAERDQRPAGSTDALVIAVETKQRLGKLRCPETGFVRNQPFELFEHGRLFPHAIGGCFDRDRPADLETSFFCVVSVGDSALCTYIPLVAGRSCTFDERPMTAFIFRCPATGYSVQGLVQDFVQGAAPDEIADADTYQAVKCTACARTHLVNPKTGKVAGAERS